MFAGYNAKALSIVCLPQIRILHNKFTHTYTLYKLSVSFMISLFFFFFFLFSLCSQIICLHFPIFVVLIAYFHYCFYCSYWNLNRFSFPFLYFLLLAVFIFLYLLTSLRFVSIYANTCKKIKR